MSGGWIQDFQNPGSEFRGAPFWSWNGTLEAGELRRQIRTMNEMGLGGFFMHSRVGLETPYLGPEWFKVIKACVDEAKQLDMKAWLYDEDRWPSGAAGGLVTKDPRYRARMIYLDQLDRAPTAWGEGVLAVFSARVKDKAAYDLQRRPMECPMTPAKGEKLLVFRVGETKCVDWFNGYTYLDTLSHEAVQEFIRVTHEAYRKNVGEDFGKLVPGIFTDEPTYFMPHGMGGEVFLPWTPKLPEVFKKRYGYDLLDRLPEIFLDPEGKELSQARYHYYDCLTHLFVDAFARQIGEWCTKNGVSHTGHILEEATLSSQTVRVGCCQRFYEYMQAPGIDILTQYNREYDTAKQVTSVARQFGWKWRLSETYGCTGWDFSFKGHKAVSDWQTALGINLRCQHLAWYTMAGEAKRDYPAAISYQSPWWRQYRKVEDYYARLHAVLTRGQEVRDLLVIQPIESAWTLARVGWREEQRTKDYDQKIATLRDWLLEENLDFDYGDEELLSRHARVRQGKDGAVFAVNQAEYKAILVPEMLTVRASTLKLLDEFRAAGGLVVFAGQVAAYVDALPNSAAAETAARCQTVKYRKADVAAAVAGSVRRVSVADGQGREIPATLYLLREDDEAVYLFICNTGYAKEFPKDSPCCDRRHTERTAVFPEVRLRAFAGCAGTPVELDPETGNLHRAAAKKSGTEWMIETSLPELASRLFVCAKAKADLPGKLLPARAEMQTLKTVKLSASAPIALSEANNLVLDRAEWKLADGKWQKPEEILRIDRKVREQLGVSPRGGGMKQPWTRAGEVSGKSVKLELRYTFTAETLPSGDLFLALERPETFRASLNGAAVAMDENAGWWVDLSLRRIRLDPQVLREGENELLLAVDYTPEHSGLEIVYLLGNFGVTLEGDRPVMTKLPAKLRCADWVSQGLAFYSGSVAYRYSVSVKAGAGQRIVVQIPEFKGVGVRVLVDGKEAGIIAWQPQELDITDYLKNGAGELALEVLGHRRNSHGPLHLVDPHPRWTGPGQYLTRDKDWTDGYHLVACGLTKPPRLAIKK